MCTYTRYNRYYLTEHPRGALAGDTLRTALNVSWQEGGDVVRRAEQATGRSSPQSLLRSRPVVVEHPIGSGSFIEEKAYSKEQTKLTKTELLYKKKSGKRGPEQSPFSPLP